eukprot:snap_masked-scaffold_81-processed-gene-0.20-mRNA-1 protein AED:0.02 eAED:0.02 QI:138/1/1/1/1/1/2/28/237
MTRTNHFILGNSIEAPFPENTESVVLATGCFWGAEKSFWRMPGVYTTAVGYAGGSSAASYEQVCTGRTGHTEAVLVVWETDKLSYTDIIRQFLANHDPTQINGQGNDHGSQYRGAVYYETEDQKRITEAAFESFNKTLKENRKGKIATEVKGDQKFFYAEEYHQQYLAKPGSRPYCSARPLGIRMEDPNVWLPEDMKEKYAPKLSEEYWNQYMPSPHCVIRDPHEQIKWSVESGANM